jgi:hypothetical protein
MAQKLGGFALTGQGLGNRSKKARVAAGGRATADDRKQAVGFTSGKMSRSKGDISNPRMNQAPAKTSSSKKGVSGSGLPLGKQKSGSGVTGMRLKNSGRGARGPLPLGRAEQTSPISSSLKNTKK